MKPLIRAAPAWGFRGIGSGYQCGDAGAAVRRIVAAGRIAVGASSRAGVFLRQPSHGPALPRLHTYGTTAGPGGARTYGSGGDLVGDLKREPHPAPLYRPGCCPVGVGC